jgi:argininosuccinate lyase
MVRQLLNEGRDFDSLTLGEWQAFSPRFDADVKDRVTTAASVRARRTPQSTHPDAVARRIAEVEAWLAGGALSSHT